MAAGEGQGFDGMSAPKWIMLQYQCGHRDRVCGGGGTCWMQMVLNCCLCFPSGVKPSLPYLGGGGGADVLGK